MGSYQRNMFINQHLNKMFLSFFDVSAFVAMKTSFHCLMGKKGNDKLVLSYQISDVFMELSSNNHMNCVQVVAMQQKSPIF